MKPYIKLSLVSLLTGGMIMGTGCTTTDSNTENGIVAGAIVGALVGGVIGRNNFV